MKSNKSHGDSGPGYRYAFRLWDPTPFPPSSKDFSVKLKLAHSKVVCIGFAVHLPGSSISSLVCCMKLDKLFGFHFSLVFTFSVYLVFCSNDLLISAASLMH